MEAIAFSLKLFEIFFFKFGFGLVWFDLVVYQVSTFYYVWNGSKSLVWWWWLGGWIKATLVFICGPNLETRTLSWLWPKLNYTNQVS